MPPFLNFNMIPTFLVKLAGGQTGKHVVAIIYVRVAIIYVRVAIIYVRVAIIYVRVKKTTYIFTPKTWRVLVGGGGCS